MDMKDRSYFVSFKEQDGSHHSSKTMSVEEYIFLLQETVKKVKDPGYKTPFPSVNFTVQERSDIFETKG